MKKSLKVLSALAIAAAATATVASCSKTNTTSTQEPTPSASQPVSTPTSTPTSTPSSTNGGQQEELSISLDTTAVKTQYIIGQEFSAEGLVVTASDGTVLEQGIGDKTYSVVTTGVQIGTVGEYTVTIVGRLNGKTATSTYKITVVDAIWVDINSVEDFMKMRSDKDENGYNDKSYRLTADIDLKDVTIEDSAVIFRGTFDGNGHTIKNASYAAGTSKVGLLFKQLAANAVVKNVRFFNCNLTSKEEAIALIAGEINEKESDVLVQNVEVSMCTVETDNSYAAVLIARNETNAINVTFDRITVKNFTSVKCTSYGGGLYGDILGGSSIKVINSDIDLTFTTSQNGSYLVGRNRGANIDVENVIIRGDIKEGKNSTGYITGGGKACKNAIIKNVLVLGTSEATGNLLLGNSTFEAMDAANNYYVNQGSASAVTNATQITAATFTADWAFTTLKLDNTIWEVDDTTVVKLKGSSQNTPASDATVSKLAVSTAGVKTEFFKTETFNTTGLAVSIIWSDGCLTSAEDGSVSVKLLNKDGQEVNKDDLSQLAIGQYVVEVSASVEGKGSAKYTYDIDLVEYTATKVVTDDAKLVYTVGEKLSFDNLYVFAVKSNKNRTLLKTGEYTVVLKDAEGNVIDSTKAFAASGVYNVTISANEFSQEFSVNVVAPEENKALVQVIVSKTAEDGKWTAAEGNDPTAGHYSFSTIEKAINYLQSLSLAEDAVKLVYVEDGTYEEKITINVPNVTLVGQSKDKTIITSSFAEGSKRLNDNGTYGMDCATLVVTSAAKGFSMSNITVRNDFDYKNSTIADKQAFALQCDADESTFNNCYFYGVQDTLYANDGRQYYYGCRIDGAVDFICGQKDVAAVFDNCTIHAVTRYNTDGVTPAANNGYVFAPKSVANPAKGLKYNYVVINSTFEADSDTADGSMSVARPWGAEGGVAVLNSTFSKAYSTAAYDGKAKPRYDAMSGSSPEKAFFFEYNNTGDGALTAAVNGMKMLTEAEAQEYTVENIFKAANGAKTFDRDWNPTGFYSANEVVYVSYYEPKTAYTVGDAYTESSKAFYRVTFDAIAGTTFTIDDLTSETTEKIVDKDNAEVTKENMVATAGEYTQQLIHNNKVVDSAKVVVNEAGLQEYTITTTADAIKKAGTAIVSGEAINIDGGWLTLYGKNAAGEGAKTTANEVTLNEVTYANALQLSGGKATVTAESLLNCLKFTLAHDGTVTFVIGGKNDSDLTGKKPSVWNSAYTVAKEWDVNLPAKTSKTAISISVELKAGTYYFGAASSGCYLYSVSYTYKA